MNRMIVLVPLLALVACAPRRIHEEPILETGDRVEDMDAWVDAVRNQAALDQARLLDKRDSISAVAPSNCEPESCAAVARGEIALGMTEAQVLAATSTTREAWAVRTSGPAAVMVPASLESAPRDVVGQVAMVQFNGGRVATYSYREAQGVRVVADAADATTEGRASALAAMLIREGDDLAARGDLAGALDRYDRASVLRPNDPLLDYRIATVLDKQLRPIEALIQYQLFLHRLELERIEAVGDAYAKLADAIAHARERVIILEKHGS